MSHEMFGRYLLLDRVAAGGMAEVWRGKVVGEDGFQRIVALKKILPHVAEDEDFITMFRDEAKITVQLQHSNIGQVYDFNRVDDVYFIAMEYISGKDLKSVWKHLRQRRQVLPVELALYIVQQMAEGLDYAHRKRDNFGTELGIVHRDVSPQNVLISWDGEVKVIDFGIAKAANKLGRTQAGVLKGKFGYMAPEQIRGLGLDGRSDVFALGVVLWELLCGRRAFTGNSDFELLEKVRSVDVQRPREANPNVPEGVDAIVMKALAADRDERYLHASELSQDIQRYLLNAGRPPSRHELAAFLREQFTVEYDKERLRLESYRDIKPPPPKAKEPQPQAPQGPPPVDPAMAAVQAAMMAEGTMPNVNFSGISQTAGDVSGAYSIPPGQTNAGQAGTGSHGGLHPNTYVGPPGSQTGEGTHSGNTGVTQTGAHPQMVTTGGIRPSLALNQETSPTGVVRPGMDRGTKIKIAAAAAGVVLLAVVALLALRPGKGTVVVSIQGAESGAVMLDATMRGNASPSLTLTDIGEGGHTLVVSKDGFESYVTQIEMQAGQVLQVPARLKPVKKDPTRVSVSSNVAGAAIFVDGQDTGKKTPSLIEMKSGLEHLIVVKKQGFADAKAVKLKGEPKALQEVNVVLKPSVLNITITSEPEGAKVFIDGKNSGQVTPASIKRDPEGAYPRLELKKRGCRTMKTSVPFDADKAEQSFNYDLKC